MTSTTADSTGQAQGNPSSWFTNKEWGVLVAAIGVATAGIVAAAMTPGGAIASAATTPSAAPGHVCAKPAQATAATETAAVATTSTPVTSETTDAEPIAAATTSTARVVRRVGSAATKRTATTATKKKASKPAGTSPKKTDASLVSAGLVVDLGSYKGVPLRWLVLDSNDDQLLLLSERVISAGAFRSDWEGANAKGYAASEVRNWLTTTFDGQAFTDEQRGALLPHEGGVASGDKVFLLNSAEVKRYLPSKSDRQAKVSDAASGAGFSGEELTVKGGHAQWWLSDAATGEAKAQTVQADGSFSSELVYYADLGVRPAIRVDRSKIALTLDSSGGN